MRFHLLVVTLLLTFVSCSSTPEEMIIGTWRFKAVHCDQSVIDSYGQYYIDQLDSSMATLVMEFGEDGSYTSRYTNMPGEIHGTYSSNGDGTFSVRAVNSGTTEEGTITRVEEDELVLQAQGWAYLLVR